jgi:hypothetical protein
MTKTRLAYAVYLARKAVSWERNLPVNPQQMIGRFKRLLARRTQPSSARLERTCSEANPPPMS